MAPVLSTMRDSAPAQVVSVITRRAVAASAPGMTLAIGLGAGIGAVIFIGCVAIIIRIVYKRKSHQKALEELQQGVVTADPPTTTQQQTLLQLAVPHRPTSLTRYAHWGQDDFHAVSSDEAIMVRPEPVAEQPQKRKRISAGMPKRIKPWTRKHLSTITESPRIASLRQSAGNWSYEAAQALDKCSPPRGEAAPEKARLETIIGSPAIGSPKFTTSPRLTMHPPAKFGTAILNIDRQAKPHLTIVTRSVSMGAFSGPVSDEAIFDSMPQRPQRPEMHARSVSLGAPTTKPPSGPVPPVPTISRTMLSGDESSVPELCVSRLSSSSSSSGHSTDSSVLVTSPVQQRNDAVTEKNAETRPEAHQAPRISRPRPASGVRVSKTRSSKAVRVSTEGRVRSDSASTTSSTDSSNRLSVPEICSAERISLSRISSSHSLTGSISGVQKISTPTKRGKRMSNVSLNGSPAQRRRASALREVSGNVVKQNDSPIREPSASTLLSRSSSNGNPFQWDTTSISTRSPSANKSKHVRKPSALKGSPHARKGHKRQQCVRIVTEAPEEFPARHSRSCTPSPIDEMDAIREQRESDEITRAQSEPLVTPTEERNSYFRLTKGGRAPSANALDVKNLRVQTLRASLTPSSPTLSAWNGQSETEQQGVRGRQQSEDMTATSRPESTISERSFIIPKFPVPVNKARASISPIQCDTTALPEFVTVTSPVEEQMRDSNTSDEASPITPADDDMDMDMPSSPPVARLSKTQEYDPSWPMLDIKLPSEGRTEEYDPTSPPSRVYEERSSLFLPFAMVENLELSPRSRPTSYVAQPISPPCSPTRVNEASSSSPQPEVPERNPARDTLTSLNASSMINFPGINLPILAPPRDSTILPTGDENEVEEEDYSTITLSSSPPPMKEQGPTFALARAPTLSTIIQSSSPPASPSTTTATKRTSIMGPRAEPAKPMIKNISTLRRMNSTASPGAENEERSRESRTYLRLGRESSPLLPWVPSSSTLEGGKSASDLMASATIPTVDQPTSPTGLDDIDFETMERNIDGALSSFDAEYRFSRFSVLKQQASPSAASVSAYSTPAKVDTTGEVKRMSSVWDDGEEFWWEEKKKKTPAALKTPLAKLKGESGVGTPGSLYDSEGFLKA